MDKIYKAQLNKIFSTLGYDCDLRNHNTHRLYGGGCSGWVAKEDAGKVNDDLTINGLYVATTYAENTGFRVVDNDNNRHYFKTLDEFIKFVVSLLN